MKKIKLIWDFRGMNAEGLAKHHAKHINEYIEFEKIKDVTASWEKATDTYFIAYLIILENELIKFRDALKPHRAIYWEE